METAYFETPLGIAEIKGDEQGLISISILKESPEISDEIPDIFKNAVLQLEEYYASEKHFS